MVAIKQDATVGPGGTIAIRSDQLLPGAHAEVIVIIDEPAPALSTSLPTMRSLLGAARGGFQSSAEVDTFLRQERDAWER